MDVGGQHSTGGKLKYCCSSTPTTKYEARANAKYWHYIRGTIAAWATLFIEKQETLRLKNSPVIQPVYIGDLDELQPDASKHPNVVLVRDQSCTGRLAPMLLLVLRWVGQSQNAMAPATSGWRKECFAESPWSSSTMAEYHACSCRM